MPPERPRGTARASPLGRAGQPAEVAPAYVFFASQESSYITAEMLAVTGGSPSPDRGTSRSDSRERRPGVARSHRSWRTVRSQGAAPRRPARLNAHEPPSPFREPDWRSQARRCASCD